jgi:hypothetical protein
MVFTSPVAIVAAALSLLRGRPVTESRQAVLELAGEHGGRPRTVKFKEFSGINGAWRRWPRLWKVVRREFAWVGNPPLEPDEAARLAGEWERRWLDMPPGVFTAPECEGCSPPWDDEARAHAVHFASLPTPRWRRRILGAGLRSLCRISPGATTR